jgi:phosphoglycolate phosphatase-like HAD superfamily hydrolase
MLFVLVISFYVVKDAPQIGRFIATRLPEPLRPELKRLWSELALIWDAWVRGILTLGLAMGVIVWLATTILGVRNAPALGLMAGILEFIPGVGPTVGAMVAVLIALILGSTWLPLPNMWFAVLVAVVYFLLYQFENVYLLPRLVGRRIALHPAVVIVTALAGAQLAGVLGILLAAPTVASIRTLFAYAFNRLLDQEPFPTPAAPPGPESFWVELARSRPVRAVLFDLDGTLIETDDQLVQRLAQRLGFLQRLLPGQDVTHLARRCLMLGEGMANGVVTLLDRLRLDGLLFRAKGKLRRWQGIREPGNLVPVAGSAEMLRVLAKRYPLGIVTSRDRRETAAFLNQCGLNGLFKAVVTRDDVKRLKPHPMAVRLAAKQIGVAPEQCVMVGDTGVDVRSAKAAGALAVGVLCGFGEMDDFKAADLVLESTAQLAAWL